MGETPPVGIILVQGHGPLIAFTKSGPYIPPGKSFTISQPNSSALAISLSEPQPGDQRTFLLLHASAISSLKTGVTIKFAPHCMYKDAAPASVMEPTPIIIPGRFVIAYLFSVEKTSNAK